MQLRHAYPDDAVAGACFVTGDYDPTPGVIDLDIFVDSMPPWGRLCLSAKAVRDMVVTLGWTWPSDDVLDANVELADEARVLREENQRLRNALAHILDAKTLARIDTWAAVKT